MEAQGILPTAKHQHPTPPKSTPSLSTRTSGDAVRDKTIKVVYGRSQHGHVHSAQNWNKSTQERSELGSNSTHTHTPTHTHPHTHPSHLAPIQPPITRTLPGRTQTSGERKTRSCRCQRCRRSSWRGGSRYARGSAPVPPRCWSADAESRRGTPSATPPGMRVSGASGVSGWMTERPYVQYQSRWTSSANRTHRLSLRNRNKACKPRSEARDRG